MEVGQEQEKWSSWLEKFSQPKKKEEIGKKVVLWYR